MALAVPERDLARLRQAIARIEGRPAVRLTGRTGDAAPRGEGGRAAAGAAPRYGPACGDAAVVQADAAGGCWQGRQPCGETSNPAPRGANDDRPPQAAPHGRLATGARAFDRALAGGLNLGGLGEIRCAATADAGAAAGFVAALLARMGGAGPVLWIGAPQAFAEGGRPHAPGLARLGFDPVRLLLACPPRLADALWIAGEAARVAALAAAVLEVRGNPRALDLTATRRLAMAARAAARPVLLLRQAGDGEASAASWRLCVTSAPASPPRLLAASALETAFEAGVGPLAFAVTIEKLRGGAPVAASFMMEWNADERAFADIVPSGRAAAAGPLAEPLSGAGAAAPVHRPHCAQPLGQVVAFDRAS